MKYNTWNMRLGGNEAEQYGIKHTNTQLTDQCSKQVNI